jgi:uncharacterized protein (DUF169 family)
MLLPSVLAQGAVTSAGCLGNRVYNDLGDDELYMLVPGRVLQKLADEVQVIANANIRLTEYHRGRRKSLRASME